jgi:hypothetical protein
MKRIVAIAALCSVMAVPAYAQSTDTKKEMMKPTMVQCQGGYKSEYMGSMKWSKSSFDSACKSMMSKDKMAKPKT